MTEAELASRARELLADPRGTPRPWLWRYEPGELHVLESTTETNCASDAIVLTVQVGYFPSPADMRMIAQAPTLLEDAVVEIERLIAKLHDANDSITRMRHERDTLIADEQAALQRAEQAEERDARGEERYRAVVFAKDTVQSHLDAAIRRAEWAEAQCARLNEQWLALQVQRLKERE